jgi:hypothetical protein
VVCIRQQQGKGTTKGKGNAIQGKRRMDHGAWRMGMGMSSSKLQAPKSPKEPVSRPQKAPKSQRAKDSGRSLTWRQEIVSNLETGDRRKLFFEGAEVWGSGFFPSWIDIAWMAKVRPSFLLCLPTQLLTPILCTAGQLHFLPNEREAFSQQNLDRCNRRQNSRSMRWRALKIYLITTEEGFTKVQFRKSTNDRAKT